MFVVIVVGFLSLITLYIKGPSKVKQGESLCSKYLPFYEREIKDGKIEFIRKKSSQIMEP